MGLTFLFLGIVVLSLIAVSVLLIKRSRFRAYLHERPYLSSASLDVLSEQLMRGEITSDEYQIRSAEIRKRTKAA